MDVLLVCKSCEFRGQHFEGPVGLWHQHNYIFHSYDNEKCGLCPMRFESLVQKEIHESEDHKLILCLECDRLALPNTHKTYIAIEDMDAHYSKYHKDHHLKCESCHNRFQAISQLQQHLQAWHHYNPVAPHIQCVNCDKILPNRKAMEYHSAGHSDKPELCKNCFNGYGDKQQRKEHQKTCKVKYD